MTPTQPSQSGRIPKCRGFRLRDALAIVEPELLAKLPASPAETLSDLELWAIVHDSAEGAGQDTPQRGEDRNG